MERRNNFSYIGYDEQTEVLTEFRGWVLLSQLLLNDKVMTLNMGSHKFEYQTPILLESENYKGKIKLYELKCSKWNFSMNNNQKVVMYKKPFDDYVFREINYLLTIRNNNCEIMNTIRCENSEYQLDKTIFTDMELVIIGLIITDGNEYDNIISIYQSKIQNLEIIRNLLKQNNIQFKESIRQRNIKEICGKKLKNKPLPEHQFKFSAESSKKFLGIKRKWYEILKDISIRQTEFLLKGLIIGDGNKRGNTDCCSLFCGSKEMSDIFQIFFIKRGINASIYIPKERKNDYRLNITHKNSSTFYHSFPKALLDIDYVGKIYKINTPNSTILIRRKGKTLISGCV